MTVELLIPRPGMQPMDLRGVKMSWWNKISYVARSLEECHDIVPFFGHPRFCPPRPILLLIPGTEGFLVEGMGVTDAAEMQDLCVTTWGRYLNRIKENNGKLFDFATLREKHGVQTYEDFDAEMRQQLTDYAETKKRNRRTLPDRSIQPGEHRVFGMGASA